MGACSLEPDADRLVFMPRDLLGGPQAASSHHDQQRLGYLRGLGLQSIHWGSVRVPKVGLAGAAAIPPAVLDGSHCAPHGTLDSPDSDTRGDWKTPSSFVWS